MSVAEPFAEDFPGVPHTQVYTALHPVIEPALTGLSQLAETLSNVGAGILQAVIDAQKQEPQQVAVAALLSGTSTIMAAYRQHIHTIGTHMGTATAAVKTAWNRYGHDDTWGIPQDLRTPQLPEVNITITVAEPRPLTTSEDINSDYLEDILGRVRHVSASLVTPSIKAFTAFVRGELPVGELAEALDTIMVEHASAMATTTTAMKQHIHRLADTITTNHHHYRDSGLWAAPHVHIS